MTDPTRSEDTPVNLDGDTYMTFTAPFYERGDPLEPREACVLPEGNDLDGMGCLLRDGYPLTPLLQGTLTYDEPKVDVLTGFAGSAEWCGNIRQRLNDLLDQQGVPSRFDSLTVVGLLFPDGYGSVAVTIKLTNGWSPAVRATTLSVVGRDGREQLAGELRELLLKPLERLLRRCGLGESTVAHLPYFNLTYAGSTLHPAPGRSSLDDSLRTLVYPDSPMPLKSCSPWLDQFLYAGYAYNLLAMRDPQPGLTKLALLLLILDVSYARLARTAAAADASLLSRRYNADIEWLTQLEHRLRSEFQSLVTPTFSYDHHTLKLRDGLLRAWDAAKLQSRAENLLAIVRRTVEMELAERQARRIRRVNLVVTVLTVLSAVATAEAAVSLFDYFFG